MAVNCSGLTDTLLEAELFGHTKGAFTGAVGERSGLFEAADGGTIFLDELASTSAGFQASLLRVLQSGEVRRVGSTQTKRINVRVIAASNASLREMASAGQFRPDLFYRLSVITLELPTLRERGGDVDVLAAHFLRAAAAEGRPPYRLTREAACSSAPILFPAMSASWKMPSAVPLLLCPNDMITLDCLPPEIAAVTESSRASVDYSQRANNHRRPSDDGRVTTTVFAARARRESRKEKACRGGSGPRSPNGSKTGGQVSAALPSRMETTKKTPTRKYPRTQTAESRDCRTCVRRRILANRYQVLIFCALALACAAQSARAQVAPVEARIASVSGTVLLSIGAQAPTAAKRGDVLIPGEEIDTRGGGHVSR